MVQLAPSILAADFSRLGEEVEACEGAGAHRIHIDVMDNHFVPNLSMGPEVVAACRRHTSLPLEVHLMVERPDSIIPAFIEAGCGTVTVHLEAGPQPHRSVALIHQLGARLEAGPQPHRSVALIHQLGARAGMAINPGTATSLLRPLLPEVELALVMSVDPGFGGQRLLPQSLPRLREVAELISQLNPDCELEVDGGVDCDNVSSCVSAGATVVVAGTSVFAAPRGTAAGVGCLLERISGGVGGQLS